MFAEHWTKFLAALEKGIRGLLPLLALLIYTLIGAWIFMHIEGPNEKFQLEKSRKMHIMFLENTTHDLLKIRSMEYIPAKTYVEYHLLRYIGTLGIKQINVNHVKWDIWGSIYYTFCIYTTIGYGNIHPTTATGRVFTIIYAFIGIPLAVLCLIALGRLLAKLFLALWTVLVRAPLDLVLKNFRKVIKFDTDNILSEAEDSEEDLLRFPLSFLILIAFVWVLFSAYVLFQWESDWDFAIDKRP
uniref:Potassium channel domain-containing protein n=1 Tax=Acrobeloides nanus TaxID=290746 RepID=A0A914CHZ6_9BILA